MSYLRGRNPIAAVFALQMPAFTDGGDAHGEDDYRQWLTDTSYRPPQVHDLDNTSQTIILAEV